MMHTPYEVNVKHKADFKVKYQFFNKAEGGRQNLPHQGYRSDFGYLEDDPEFNSIYMIWPEFLDAKGQIILDKEIAVPEKGYALMWILVPEMRLFHQNKIIIGTRGFAMEGKRKVAKYEVVEIIDLHKNPIHSINLNIQRVSKHSATSDN